MVILTDDAHSWEAELCCGIKIDVAVNARYYYQYHAMQQLRADASQAAKLHVFQLMRDGARDPLAPVPATIIYNHAKIYMADDAFMIAGSTGIERTGFTNDIELSIGIFDPAFPNGGPDSFIGRLRRTLWAEHLRLSVDDPVLRDPLRAVGEWDRQAALTGGASARVRPYWPHDLTWDVTMAAVYSVYEPDGRCAGQQTSSALFGGGGA